MRDLGGTRSAHCSTTIGLIERGDPLYPERSRQTNFRSLLLWVALLSGLWVLFFFWLSVVRFLVLQGLVPQGHRPVFHFRLVERMMDGVNAIGASQHASSWSTAGRRAHHLDCPVRLAQLARKRRMRRAKRPEEPPDGKVSTGTLRAPGIQGSSCACTEYNMGHSHMFQNSISLVSIFSNGFDISSSCNAACKSTIGPM